MTRSVLPPWLQVLVAIAALVGCGLAVWTAVDRRLDRTRSRQAPLIEEARSHVRVIEAVLGKAQEALREGDVHLGQPPAELAAADEDLLALQGHLRDQSLTNVIWSVHPHLVLVTALWRSVWLAEEQLARAREEQQGERVRLERSRELGGAGAESESVARRSRFSDPDRMQLYLTARATELREELEKTAAGPLQQALRWIQRYDKGHAS